MTQLNPWGATISQIMAARVSERLKPGAGFNPRPPGIAIEGSATTAVLKFLRENPRVWFNHAMLVHQTGRSRVAVDWALIRLRGWGLVETCEDPRSSKYFRYRITSKGMKR